MRISDWSSDVCSSDLTPSAGVRDLNFTLTKKFPAIPVLPALSATIAYHKFDSDIDDLDSGQVWDAQVGFKLLETAVLLQYADFDSRGIGADTRKFCVKIGGLYRSDEMSVGKKGVSLGR